jgi:hypothetical protein
MVVYEMAVVKEYRLLSREAFLLSYRIDGNYKDSRPEDNPNMIKQSLSISM